MAKDKKRARKKQEKARQKGFAPDVESAAPKGSDATGGGPSSVGQVGGSGVGGGADASRTPRESPGAGVFAMWCGWVGGWVCARACLLVCVVCVCVCVCELARAYIHHTPTYMHTHIWLRVG